MGIWGCRRGRLVIVASTRGSVLVVGWGRELKLEVERHTWWKFGELIVLAVGSIGRPGLRRLLCGFIDVGTSFRLSFRILGRYCGFGCTLRLGGSTGWYLWLHAWWCVFYIWNLDSCLLRCAWSFHVAIPCPLLPCHVVLVFDSENEHTTFASLTRPKIILIDKTFADIVGASLPARSTSVMMHGGQ